MLTPSSFLRIPTSFIGCMVMISSPFFVGCSIETATKGQANESSLNQTTEVLSLESAPPELGVSSGTYDFKKNPKLLSRILAGPHGYFRFVSGAFSLAVCGRFQERLSSIPVVNLHGDAHLEQYAVTDTGRGLTDFDRSTRGMAYLDHVRFGVSIHLACLANGWAGQERAIVAEFFHGYYAALKDPQMLSPPPALVNRIRDTFSNDHSWLLKRAEGLMEPMERTEDEVKQAMQDYARQMLEQDPGITSSFFSVKKTGRLRLGIGSALDEKYLIRIEGATAAPEDDLILEAKEIRELDGIGCIEITSAEPERILKGQARIAYEPQRYAGYFVMQPLKSPSQTKTFWVFAWDDDYEELSINKSFESLEDLRSISYDVGVQLGLGHPKGMGEPDEVALRRTLSQVTGQLDDDLQRVIQELTHQTIVGWQQFCAENG